MSSPIGNQITSSEKCCFFSQPFALKQVRNIEDLSEEEIDQIVDVYQRAFANPPYCEAFDRLDVLYTMDFLAKYGTLVLGSLDQRIVSLAGGFVKSSGTYYVDELAVDPNEQRKGYGKKTLEKLLDLDAKYSQMEIRTTLVNHKAISLYESLGFVREDGLEIVPKQRQNGNLEIDQRVYLAKPQITNEQRYMQLKHMAVASPSGNITAVIFDDLRHLDRKNLNSQIISSWKNLDPAKMGCFWFPTKLPEIEQCCFVTKPNNPSAIARVEMLGGEFCGNATRSVIQLITDGEDYQGLIEVSGTDLLLQFSVSEGIVSLEMPLPKETNLVEKVDEGFLVHLDGITHLVVIGQQEKSPRELFNVLKEQNKYNCTLYPAFGISYFNPDNKVADFCVWVKAVDTTFDETACGSGSCSIGIALAMAHGKTIEENIRQPSQEVISTIAEYNVDSEQVERSYIQGKVKILYDGEFFLS